MRKTLLNRTTAIMIITTVVIIVILSVFRTFGPSPEEPVNDAPAARGQLIFTQTCSGCHHPYSTQTKIGPGLQGIFDREKLPVSNRPVSEDTIRHQLKDPYQKMPRVGENLSEEQMEDLIAYLKSL